MRKRIKYYLENQESVISDSPESDLGQDQFYLNLLVEDLKKEAELMPVYSLWQELVRKCLSEQPHHN